MEVRKVFAAARAELEDEASDGDDLFSRRPLNMLEVHAKHRRRLYVQYAKCLSHISDAHYFYTFMMWCHDHHLFIHPCVRMACQRTNYRDHVFTVAEDTPRLTPLLAIPETLLLGFKDPVMSVGEDHNRLYDAQREKEFNALNTGGNTDADICEFFFSSLGMIVSDLVTAKASALTDRRHSFSESLGMVRTLKNAPYFEDDTTFDPTEPCLADVLLQMIRNYINGGPLVNKIPKQDLQWAVSVCLSHATPLRIGSTQSIGIIPMVHLFPHGGEATNAYIVARTARETSSRTMNKFFREHFGYDFSSLYSGKWVYVVSDRDLKKGEEIRMQAMAPVCDKDSEASQMWRLSCGSVPDSFRSSSAVSQKQESLTQEIIRLGEKS